MTDKGREMTLKQIRSEVAEHVRSAKARRLAGELPNIDALPSEAQPDEQAGDADDAEVARVVTALEELGYSIVKWPRRRA